MDPYDDPTQSTAIYSFAGAVEEEGEGEGEGGEEKMDFANPIYETVEYAVGDYELAVECDRSSSLVESAKFDDAIYSRANSWTRQA